jgi:pimeloyl-ACP methyl ester carboxylesterase
MFHDAGKIDALAVELQADNTARARIDSVVLAQSTNIPEIMATLRVPIDGIWGAFDAVSRQNLPLLRELLSGVDPASEFVVVDNAGHWVQYEAAEIVNRTLPALLAAPRARPFGTEAPRARKPKTGSHAPGPAA